MPGLYELPKTSQREVQANEYYNTRTQDNEIVEFYGLYRIQESFLTPDGTILLLAYNKHAAQPWAVGEHGGVKDGVFWRDAADARRNFAWAIAESFGLTVDKEGSKAVVPASRQYATTLVQQIRKTAGDLASAIDDQDVQGLDRSAAAVRDAAEALGKHLQRIGVLTEPVYESWEAIG